MNLDRKLEPKKTLLGIGQQIKKARLEKGLTQQELAQPEFSKGYISALERGAVRPSLKALSVFARRLDLTIGDFLGVSRDLQVEPDLNALEEDVQFQFTFARMLIRSNEIEEALEMVAIAEQEIQQYGTKIKAIIRYRIPFLRGLAFLQRLDPGSARTELMHALTLAASEGEPEVAVRNILGVAYYQLGQPQFALEQHLKCLHYIESGAVKDMSLSLSVFRNLANDYWALDDLPQAIGVYKTALQLLSDVNDLGRQAAIYWGLASAYRASGDWAQAKIYATRALHIYEAEQDRTGIASISMNLAELFLKEARYSEAEQLLSTAQTLLSGTNNDVLLSNLHLTYADLASRQGELDKAREHIGESIGHSEPLVENVDSGGKLSEQAPVYAVRTYVQALQMAAIIEEKDNNRESADELFQKALLYIRRTSFKETEYDLTFAYAEILKARGSLEEAIDYYRIAAQLSHRPAQMGN